jgi:hypothetical protein
MSCCPCVAFLTCCCFTLPFSTVCLLPSADALAAQAGSANDEEEGEHGDEHDEEQADEHDEEGADEQDEEQAYAHDEEHGEDGRRALQDEHGEDEHEDEQDNEHQDEQQEDPLDSPDTIALANETVVAPMNYFVPAVNFAAGGEWATEEPGQPMYLPRWQSSPYAPTGLVNANLLKEKESKNIALRVIDSGVAVVGGFLQAPPGNADSPHPTTSLMAKFDALKHEGDDVHGHEDEDGDGPAYGGDPVSNFFLPMFDKLKGDEEKPRKVVGILVALLHWLDYFNEILPDSVPSVVLVLEYGCSDGFVHDQHGGGARNLAIENAVGDNVTQGSPIEDEHGDEQSIGSGGHEEGHQEQEEGNVEVEENNARELPGVLFTYRLQGSESQVVGSGDLHDPKFDRWARTSALQGKTIDDGTPHGIPVDARCLYRVHVYPSQAFYDEYNTSDPLIITLVIVAVFIFAILMFILYDRLVICHRCGPCGCIYRRGNLTLFSTQDCGAQAGNYTEESNAVHSACGVSVSEGTDGAATMHWSGSSR